MDFSINMIRSFTCVLCLQIACNSITIHKTSLYQPVQALQIIYNKMIIKFSSVAKFGNALPLVTLKLDIIVESS